MKKVLFALCLITLFSCSSNESDINDQNVSLVGKWKIMSVDGVAYTGCRGQYGFLTLNSNLTGVMGAGEVINGNCSDQSSDCKYSVSDNVLKLVEINSNTPNYVYEERLLIISNSGTVLILKALSVKESGFNGKVDEYFFQPSEQKGIILNKI